MNKRQDYEKVHEIKDDIGVNMQQSENRIKQIGDYMPNVNLEILEGKYQAKTEALEYKLRYEQTQKELENANRKIMDLENELDQYENEGEEESDGYMGAIMEIAKTSPELGNALGKLLQNPKVQNFVVNLIPDTAQKQ
jgi:chromosome segregation ATPase